MLNLLLEFRLTYRFCRNRVCRYGAMSLRTVRFANKPCRQMLATTPIKTHVPIVYAPVAITRLLKVCSADVLHPTAECTRVSAQLNVPAKHRIGSSITSATKTATKNATDAGQRSYVFTADWLAHELSVFDRCRHGLVVYVPAFSRRPVPLRRGL